MNKTILSLGVFAVAALGGVHAHARGLLGERYVNAGVAVTRPGNDEVEEIDDTIVGYGASFNLPVQRNMDVELFASHSELDGESDVVAVDAEQTDFGAGLVGHVSPGQKADPWVSVRLIYAESETSFESATRSLDEDDSKTIVSVGTGVQMDLGHDFIVSPDINISDVGDAANVSIGVSLNKWLNQRISLQPMLNYDLDEEDFSAGFFVNVSL